MIEPRALTVRSNGGLLPVIQSQVRIAEPSIDYTKPPTNMTDTRVGIWDTGASGSAITQSVIDELHIQPISLTQVHGVHGPKESRVYLVDLLLPSGVGIPGLKVTLAELTPQVDVLIGMDVISRGDFAITNLGGDTTMSFRVPSMIDLDFVKAPGSATGTNRAQRRAKVPGAIPVAPKKTPNRKGRR